MIKLTTEEFVKKAKEIHGDRYDYSLVEYVNAITKVKIICKEHGIFNITPNSHLNSSGCCFCNKARKSNTEEFIKKSIKIFGDKYNYDKVVYINNKTPVEIYCNKCNSYFLQKPYNHIRKHGCDVCGGTYKISNEEFIKKSIKIFGDVYKYDETIVKSMEINVILYCKKCNVYFEQTPYSHLKGLNGCVHCSKGKRGNKDSFIYKAIKKHNSRYNYDKVVYINNKTPVEIYCNKCNVYFWQRPSDHVNGTCGCVRCNTSKGEKVIKCVLDKFEFSYVCEKRFEDCKLKKPLPFDFYLPDSNVCIEYDGEQHYKPHSFLHKSGITEEEKQNNLKSIQLKDKIKTEYCLNNNIKLIRIPYWDKDKIEEILTKELM